MFSLSKVFFTVFPGDYILELDNLSCRVLYIDILPLLYHLLDKIYVLPFVNFICNFTLISKAARARIIVKDCILQKEWIFNVKIILF